MPFDTTPYAGEPPFDAQYVGTFQPLYGWIGNTGKRRVREEVAALFEELTAKVAPKGSADDVRMPGFDGVNPFGRATIGRRNWGLQLLRRAGSHDRNTSPGSAGGAGNGGAPAPGGGAAAPGDGGVGGGRDSLGLGGRRVVASLVGEAWSALRLRRENGLSTATLTRPADATTANGHRETRLQSATLAALDAAANSPGFTSTLDASLQETGRTLADLIGWMDEFDFDRDDARLILSPIGLLNLYREYYFDFGTRLGPPVEHLWIAPGSDVEITESYSRTDYSFVEFERTLDETSSIEETVSEAETFSEEVERAQQRDISVGIVAQGGYNAQVYNVSASASFDYANSLTESRRQALESTREVSRKVAKEMRRSSRALTRTSTEIQQSSVRRHRLTNPTGDVRNLEMRRKLQHIGVQVQHLGTAMCWQTFVPDPGTSLRLSELVHIGASEDFMTTPPPDDAPVTLPPKTTEYECRIPFSPVQVPGQDQTTDGSHKYYRNDNLYEGLVVATHDPAEDPKVSDDVIRASFTFTELPTDGYTLEQVMPGAARGETPGKKQPTLWDVHIDQTPNEKKTGTFRVILDSVNFEEQVDVKLTVRLLWKPPDPVMATTPTPAGVEHDQAMQRKARQALVAGVRERVKLASQITPRHPDDLRAEERSVIYRHLIHNLVGGAVGDELHLVSEKIRTIFDVDRMLYYVAPDWWNPTASNAALDLPTVQPANAAAPAVVLEPRDRTRYREDGDGLGYLITEESAPAPLGRSLGWLAQLDGDDRRNIFLNSPWVRAVLPIRSGFEAAALTFLSQPHVEGADGLAEEYRDDNGPSGQTIQEQLLALAREIRRQNDPDAVYAHGQAVYENGFQPVDGRVRLTDQPLDVFAEWVEVVPTRQVVPVTYQPPVRFQTPAPPAAPAPPGAPAPLAGPPAAPPPP